MTFNNILARKPYYPMFFDPYLTEVFGLFEHFLRALLHKKEETVRIFPLQLL